MDGTASWRQFEVTGRIEDYLRYKGETAAKGSGADRQEFLYAGTEGEEAAWEMPLR